MLGVWSLFWCLDFGVWCLFSAMRWCTSCKKVLAEMAMCHADFQLNWSNSSGTLLAVKISIVVPAFNEEKLIVASLREIKKACAAFSDEGWQNEIIVCD